MEDPAVVLTPSNMMKLCQSNNKIPLVQACDVDDLSNHTI